MHGGHAHPRLHALAAEELELTVAEVESLSTRADARAVAVRILENLEHTYGERSERGGALLITERLMALGGPAATARGLVGSLVRSLRPERPAVEAPRRLRVHVHAFRIDDGRLVDLARRRTLPLLLARLVEHHRARATHGLGWPALVEAGWPGEKIQPDAAWGRLRTAIRTLRKLGLEEVLITIGTGYLLDPSSQVQWD